MQGATATVSLRQPRTEAHLSQLAVLENFAEHGLYVKFSNQEAEELEREALALALEESTQDVGTDRGQSGLSPEPYSQEEAERVAAQLMDDAPSNVPSNGRRRGSLKGLFGFKDKNKKDKGAQLVASQPLPGTNVQTAVARPPPPLPPSPQKKAKQPSPKKGVFQSARGRDGYDSALVDARGLRAELERGVGQFRARTDALVKQMNKLQSRLQKAGPSVQAVDELRQSQIQVETAEVQLDVIEEGIDELCNLERYLARTHPPYESAELLAHEVVRQLLACLSHVGVSSKILQATPLQGSKATKPDQRAERLVNHFRRESRSETPKPLPSLPDIPEEAQEIEEAQDGTAEDSADAAAEPQTPPRQSASKAFAAESEDGSRQSLGAVEAKPLPAQAAAMRAPQAAAQEPPVQSRPAVGIMEAKPLPARRTTPPAPEAPAAEDGRATSAALKEHALLDISSPATSMPDGSSKPSTVGSAPASHDPSLGSDASDTAAEHEERPALLHEDAEFRAADSAAVPPGPAAAAAAKEAFVPSADVHKSESSSKDLWADPVQSQQAAVSAPESQGAEALPEISQQKAAKQQQVAIPTAHGNGYPDAPHGEVRQALSKDSPSEDASQKRKKRMAFGSLFKRKSPQANGSQEAPMPAEGVLVMPPATTRAAAQPMTDATPPVADKAQTAPSALGTHTTQQSAAAAQSQAEPEEDAVGRAAAAQRRQATQQPGQTEAAAKPAVADTALAERGSLDAAVAKQSGISAKLAGASVPHLQLPPAAQRAESPADGRSGDAGALTPRADSSTGEASLAEATTRPSQGDAAARASAVRSRVRSAGARHRKGGSSYGDSSSSAVPQQLHQNDEVDGLFKDLDKVLPNNFMSQMFGDSSLQPVPGRPPSSKLTPAQKELAEQDAQKHAGLVKSLSKEITEFEAPDMPSLVEYVRNTSARLGVIMTDEAAVLAQFPTWPQGKWSALRDAADAYSELSEFARREKQWLLQRGTCEEEVQRIEAFLDTVMGRTQGAAQRAAANEALWKGQGIPWDAAIFASVRANSLHLATLYMSRVLFEVASLERSEDTVQEACLRHLAASVRAAHKIHGFAGGFDAELSALFDKVKRLAKYYVRILGPSPRHP